MRITVLYFAHARSVRGLSKEDLELPAGTTVGDLKSLLQARLGERAGSFQVARNEAYADQAAILQEGDEVAVIPPVSGGGCLVGEDRVDVEALIESVRGPQRGAICVFLGTVRNEFDGRPTARLHYEAYPEMADRELRAIASETEDRYPGSRVALYHRTGTLELTEDSVGIAVAAPHRDAAFAGCRNVIEEIKRRAPIWKREIAPDGHQHWHKAPHEVSDS